MRGFGISKSSSPTLLAILILVIGLGCSSEIISVEESDAGDLQVDAGDGEDAQNANRQEDVGEPNGGDADTGDLDVGEPDTGESNTGEPDTGESNTGEPDTGEPDTGEPDTGEPDTGEPDTGEPDTGEPDDVINCDERPPLSDFPEWSLATDVVYGSENPDPSYYTEVFKGDEFPGTSNNFPFYLEKGRYVSMEFTVPEDLIDRSGGWGVAPITNVPSISGAGRMFATLTQCPGDFDVASFDDPVCGRVAETSEGSIRTRWTTDPDNPDTRYCYIEPGETYYLNILYTHPGADPQDFPPEQSDCYDRPNCGNHFQRAFF